MNKRADIIGARRIWAEMLGDLEIAVIWDWLYYFRNAGSNPDWLAKSDAELSDELFVSTYKVRKAREILTDRGWIKTDLRRFNNAPTIHYNVNDARVQSDLRAFLRNRKNDLPKTKNPLYENKKSLTPLTTPIKEKEDRARAVDDPAGEIFRYYETEIGPLSPLVRDMVLDAVEEYPVDWIIKAVKLAVEYNARNWKYVTAILRRWKTQGPEENKKQAGSSKQDVPEMTREEFENLPNVKD